jgi:putative ABC transport system permease protein
VRFLLSRLIGVFRRRDEELDQEIQAHLDLLTDENIKQGMEAAVARRAARRAFGGVAQTKETYRDQRGLPMFDGVVRDLRIALRTSLARPWFATVVIVTLAMGIAATVAMFTALDQVVLRPLPYPDSDRLVRIESPVPGVRPDAVWNLSTAEYFYFRQAAQTLEQIGIYVTTGGTLAAATEIPGSTAERVVNGLVSSEVFGLLGIKPVVGRLFTESESRYNQMKEAPSAVILSYDLWQSHFGGSADVIARTIVFEDRAFPIVGVLGPDAGLPETTFASNVKIGIWMPLGLDPNAPAVNQHTYLAIARLKSGVTVSAAQAELDTLTTRLPDLFPSAYSPSFMRQSGFSTAVVPLRDDLLGAVRRLLWVLVVAILVVFIISAANVANLFLVRSEARRRERAVLLALGATRTDLMRHILAESLLLCVAAAGIGLLLAANGLKLLIAIAPVDIPRLNSVRLDGFSALAALGTAIVAAVSFAAVATIRSETDDRGSLRQYIPTASRRQHRLRNVLVVAQVALAVVLAAGATLMAQTVRHLLQVDAGFNASGVVTFGVMLPRVRYATEQRVADYHRELSNTLAADPDVEIVSAATSIPLDGNDGCTAVVVEDQTTGGGRQGACVHLSRVTPGYFEALRIAIRGRAPRWSDGEPWAVVSESLARRLWPGEDAIGKGIRPNGNRPPYYRVIAIAADVRHLGLGRPPVESVYFPVMSQVGAPLFGAPRGMRVVVRSRTEDPEPLTSRVRSTIARLDPSVPIANVQLLDEQVTRSMAQSSFTTALLMGAAFLAILLSAVGLYGVISYGVTSRQAELGVRLALGARPSSVRMMVIRQTLNLVLVGLAIGITASLLFTQVLSGFLFGISPRDPATLVGLSILMVGIGIAAAAAPAWRASRVDPMVALRCD